MTKDADRRLMMANPARAARDINLTGKSMGQLRTANNRRNRAIRNNLVRMRATKMETPTVKPESAAKAKSKRVAS